LNLIIGIVQFRIILYPPKRMITPPHKANAVQNFERQKKFFENH